MSDLATVDTQVAPEALPNNNSDSSVEDTTQIKQVTEEVCESVKAEKQEQVTQEVEKPTEELNQEPPKPEEEAKTETKEPEVEVTTEVETKTEEVMTEEPKEEIKALEPKNEEIKVEEPKKEETVVEECKKEEVKTEESKKESKVEEPKKQEVKVEEPKKWTSEFSTSNPITSISVNTTTKPSLIATAPVTTPSAAQNVDNRSTFSTKAPQPIALAPTASSTTPTSLSSSNSNVSSYFSSRLNAWETNTQKKQSNVSVIAQQRDSRLTTYNPPTSFTYSGSNTPRSSYHNPSAGHAPGSMAAFLGKSLGVEHQGRSTGLLKPRFDKEEEEARVWHKNRGANQQMSTVFKSVVSDTLKKDQASIDNPAQRYLQRRLTENK